PTPALNRRPWTVGGLVWFWVFLVVHLVLFSWFGFLISLSPLPDLAVICFRFLEFIFAMVFPPHRGNTLSEWLPTGLTWVAVGAFALAWGTAIFRRVQGLYRALPLFVQPRKRRLTVMRKRLAALFAVRYGLAGGGLAMLLEDDD